MSISTEYNVSVNIDRVQCLTFPTHGVFNIVSTTNVQLSLLP